MTTTSQDQADLVATVVEAQQALLAIVPHVSPRVTVHVSADEDGREHIGVDTGFLDADTAQTVRRIVGYVARRRGH